MQLWTAFIIGLIGSLHCAGMCGPIVLATSAGDRSWPAFFRGRLAYNLGRIVSYGLLGGVFGLLGRTLALAGLQRWLSIGAGALILVSCAGYFGSAWNVSTIRAVTWLKGGFGALLRSRTALAQVGLGMLNGLLPCGLVYVACLAAMASGSVASAVAYMVMFGLGTVPMMVGIGALGRNFQNALRFRFQKLIPVCLLMLGTLLVLRGMGLGIPYLSPSLSGHCPACIEK
jgi:sulfite exporter TauE/SafE